MTDSLKNQKRRDFIKGTSLAAAGAGAMAFPMISTAQTVNMRFQSTWPQKDIFHEYAVDFAEKVNGMTGGRLKIEVLPAGSVVKAFDLLDAVSKGTLDGGHGVIAYWYGKNAAVALLALPCNTASARSNNRFTSAVCASTVATGACLSMLERNSAMAASI